jgi:hypothetical protein
LSLPSMHSFLLQTWIGNPDSQYEVAHTAQGLFAQQTHQRPWQGQWRGFLCIPPRLFTPLREVEEGRNSSAR